MDENSYYIAPKDEVFEQIKAKATELWQTYDNTYGYVDEKVNRIKDIQNIRDNACYIVAMFDYPNQNKLLKMVDGEAKTWLLGLLEYSRSY